MNKKELWKKILHFVITVLTAIGTTSCTDTKKETTFTCGFLFFVGVAGFEPTTPCSQSRCANRTALHPESLLEVFSSKAMQRYASFLNSQTFLAFFCFC